MLHGFALNPAAPTDGPSDTPSLAPGLTPDQVGPGFLGFIVTFLVVAVVGLLIVDMVRRIRRVRYRAQVANELDESPPFPQAGRGRDGTPRETGRGQPTPGRESSDDYSTGAEQPERNDESHPDDPDER